MFCDYSLLLLLKYLANMYCYTNGMNKNLTTASDHFVFKSGVNKDEQYLLVKQTTSVLKHEDIVNFVGLEQQTRKYSSDSTQKS